MIVTIEELEELKVLVEEIGWDAVIKSYKVFGKVKNQSIQPLKFSSYVVSDSVAVNCPPGT